MHSHRARVITSWLPVMLWMAFIFWMSTDTFSSENTSSVIRPVLQFLAPGISSEGLDLLHAITRKLGHVTEYFILGLLLARALQAGPPSLKGRRWAVVSLIIVFVWAALDELHQSFVPTRGASAMDVGLDTFSGGLAQLVRMFWCQARRG
jgi:VanZ family protein